MLHLYSQAFRGFDIIRKQVGPFGISEDMIGINKAGVAKVWFNSDFSRSLPERPYELAGTAEEDMVRRIIEVVNTNTYIPSVPMSISEFFEQRNPLTLAAAHAVL